MSETIIRQVTAGVWTFSRPFTRFGILPLGGRSTAIKLKNGDLWVLASTPLEAETKEKLDNLGPIKYIVSANAVHHQFIGDYKKAYPHAELIAAEAAIKRHGDPNLHVDGVFGKGKKYGFEHEVEHLFFSGHKNKDVAFLHKPTKTLIQADLLFNLPPHEQAGLSYTVQSTIHERVMQYSKSKKSPTFLGLTLRPSSWLHPRISWYLGEDKEVMTHDVGVVSREWDFTRIIPCHGDVIEENAKQAWNNAFKFYVE